MLDGNQTTIDWQTDPTDLLVLPVGAFEQHSVHLPLDTDNLQADFFGRHIAQELNAALLPTLRIATSLEHTGHRGSFSLRPETLMQVVRDIADDAARQGFRILILANAHGGNHCLTPVCRDINRCDGPLKILLINYWEFRDPGLLSARTGPGCNFHANEDETSIMLALHPDRVRPERADADYSPEQLDLIQADLTTFGMGHLNPSGAIGWPSAATAERGRALVDSVCTRIVPHLRRRIERLRAHWRYAGPGGFAIRPLRAADVPEGMRLKEAAGWNQTEADWAMLLAARPEGCFAMVHNGRVVGTVTTTPYGRTAWIGMVLVDPAVRGLGLATRLMEQALDALADIPDIRLDATVAGRGVYARLGFDDDIALVRLVANAPHPIPVPEGPVRAMQAEDLPAVFALDRDRFGADRAVILKSLFELAPQRAWVVDRHGRIDAYAFGRQGSRWEQIGPLTATRPEDATALAQTALAALRGRPALMDVPLSQTAFIDKWIQAGFSEQRRFLRMVRGAPGSTGLPDTIFAAGGPEIG